MSITVSNLPQNYRTVYNPIEIVVKESDATTRGYEGFQYIIDIYETTGVVLLSRLKTPIMTHPGESLKFVLVGNIITVAH